MQTEFLNKRELTIPEKGPKALRTLLRETEEGLKSEPGLDTVRLLHDSLVFLTEFFASFAAGALKTVGPYSTGIQQLLSQPASLDRAERLLAQAFLDWKAYPHHPAYESLRDAFYLSSRLQSSRFAPRRHTRWLGVEGRAVTGLERLTRWSRRIDLAVSGNDASSAKNFIESYTPILWSWTDSLDRFFDGWAIDVSTGIAGGALSLSGSASRDDVRLDLVPVQKLSGMKSVFAPDSNGGVQLQGFAAPMSVLGGESSEGAAAVAPPAAATLNGDDLAAQLVFDPVSGEYKSPLASPVEPAPHEIPISPVEEEVGAVQQEAVAVPEAPLFATPPSELETGESMELDAGKSSPIAPETSDEFSELPGPDELPDFVDIGTPEERAAVQSDLPDLSAPLRSEMDPVLPDLSAPSETDPMLPDLSTPAVPDFSSPEVPPAPPEAATEVDPVLPDLSTPFPSETDPMLPDLSTPAVPDFSSPEVPPALSEAAAEVDPVLPELSAPSPSETEPMSPDLSTPTVPDFSSPEIPPVQPEAATEVDPVLSDLSVPSPSETDPMLPELTTPAAVPDFSSPESPLVQPEAVVEADPVLPDFSAPSLSETDPMLPDLTTPVVPDFSSPEAPLVQPEAIIEADPVLPDFSAPSLPETAPASLDFSLPNETEADSVLPEPFSTEFTPPTTPEVPSDVENPLPELVSPLSTSEYSLPGLPDEEEPESFAPEVIAESTPEVESDVSATISPGFELPFESPISEAETADFAPPTSPDLGSPDSIISASPSSDFSSAETLGELEIQPDLPDFTPPVVPSEQDALGLTVGFQSESVVEPAEHSPVLSELSNPVELPSLDEPQTEVEIQPAAPDFSPPVSQPESSVPDFSTPIPPEVPIEPVESIPTLTEPSGSMEADESAPDMAASVEQMPLSAPEAEAQTQPSAPEFSLPASQPEISVSDSPAAQPIEPEHFEPHEPEVVVSVEVPQTVAENQPAVPDFSALAPQSEVGLPDFSFSPQQEPSEAESSSIPPQPAPDVPDFSQSSPAIPSFGVPALGERDERSIEDSVTDSMPSVEPSSEVVLPEQTVEVQLPAVPDIPAPAMEFSEEAGDDGVFAPSGSETSLPSAETDAPVFASPGLETELSSSPFVAGTAQFQSVEMDSSIGSARDMGASAEEILDDNYEFSFEDGPALPKWAGWSVDQREAVQQVCEAIAARGGSKIPSVYAGFMQNALNSGAMKIQAVIERACGKSRLAADLALSFAESEAVVPILASWERGHDEEHASSQLLRFYYELVRGKKTQRGQLALPEPESVTDLAIAADREGLELAFQRLLGQIATINRKDVIFFLDEPPEAIRRAIGKVNAPGVRFVSFVNPGDQSDDLGQMLDLRGKWKQAAIELLGEQVGPYCEKTGATLLRVALLRELLNANSPVPDDMSRVEEALVESPAVSRDLMAVLSLEDNPVSLDDLDQWFLDADEVSEAVTAFPSLFEVAKTRLSPVISLTHPTVLKLVEEKCESARAKSARKLLGWVVAQLEKTNPEKYGGLQVREIVFRNFIRLYRFAQLSADPKILEWVMRNKELQRRRVALNSHLEKPGNRYELQTLQELCVGLLTELVSSGQCDDLRDELAWARSNLALNQLKLGQLPQAAEGVLAASKLFEILVNKEKQYEFRPALSTTNYRASRVFAARGDLAAATEYANLAVAGFVDLVEDRGRTELTPRLGIALAHRGSLYWDAQKSDAAKADLERAAKLLDGADTGDVQETYRTQIDIHLELVSIFTKEGNFEAAIRESGKAVQLATVAVEEKGLDDFQPTLATCHAIRAKSYFKQGEQDRALRDIAKSISLRNLSVDEGRLEQRFLLAKDLQLRAQVFQTKGSEDDASRDLNRAIELLQALHVEGRVDAIGRLVSCLLERASLLLKRGQAEAGVNDLKAGLALAGDGPELREQRLKLLDTLLQAHLQSGNVAEALSVSQGLLAQYHAAQAWEPYSRVQLVRGEALERTGQYTQALECYTQASNLLSQLLAQGQTDELLGRVAEAYLGIGSIEAILGRSANAGPQVKRAIDVFTHLFQQRKSPAALPRLLKAYSVFANIHLSGERLGEAMQALKSGFDIMGYMEAQGGKGGVPTTKGMEKLKGEMFRLRAKALLSAGDAQNALNDIEEASRNFLLTRQQPGGANWKDELGRTWALRSKILFALKDFGQAESSIQDAIGHFEERLREGRYEYFADLMNSLTVRAENSSRSGKIDQVLEEYNRMLAIITSVAKSGAKIDHEREMAKVLERRAKVYRDQGLLNEAYADYESVIGLYRSLVTQKGRAELAEELIRVHLERAQMTTKAGHAQYAVNDLGEAVNVAKALVSQGQMGAVPQLATALHRRAEIFRTLGRPAEALTDLEGAIGFRSQLAQQSKDPDQIAELGKSFLLQGTLLAAAGQGAVAAQSLDQSNGIFTSLVEQQGRKEFSSELAQGLIQRVSLSSDRSDPALRQVLIKAVDLVAKQAKEGKPIAKDFTVECLRTVVELLQREDYDTVGALIDSVLNLVEIVVTDGKSEQDFVKLTDLLLAASAGLIDDRRTARRPHFLSLACVSCNREIQMFGKNSLPRLVYCLYELGQALERSKAPAVLNYVGSSFALLGELARQQETNEDFLRELKMMVSTWRSLPPQIPALANVSRHMLSQLLRLT